MLVCFVTGPIQAACDTRSEFYIRLDAVNNFVHACLKGVNSVEDTAAIHMFTSLLNTTVQVRLYYQLPLNFPAGCLSRCMLPNGNLNYNA